MSDPFIGQIRLFGGNFAPRNYAFCDGQLLQISQNTALFSLLGTVYGGDGRTTFGLPDLRGRAPIHAGRGPGLPDFRIGQKAGTETEVITEQQLPAHNHPLHGHNAVSTTQAPSGNSLANTPSGGRGGGGVTPYGAANNLVAMAGGTTPTGGGQAHTNVQPRIALNYIIALEGIYPSRN